MCRASRHFGLCTGERVDKEILGTSGTEVYIHTRLWQSRYCDSTFAFLETGTDMSWLKGGFETREQHTIVENFFQFGRNHATFADLF